MRFVTILLKSDADVLVTVNVVSGVSRLYNSNPFVNIYPIKNAIIATHEDDIIVSSPLVPRGRVENGIIRLQISPNLALNGLNDLPSNIALNAKLSIDAIIGVKIKNPNKYSKAYTIDEMEKLGQELSLSFKINDLIGKDDIIINRGHNKFSIDFVNTRYNHLDLLKSHGKVYDISSECYEQLKEESTFYVENCGKLLTLEGTYKIIDDDFKTLFNAWKDKINFNTLSVPIDSDSYNFINQYDDKIHRFFNDEMEVNNDLYNEIDLKNAYFNFNLCDDYIGVSNGSFICVSGDGFTSELFLKQYKNKIVGFYEVVINHNNKNLELLGMKSGTKHILFSSMIKLLLNYDVSFEYINYCVSPSVDVSFTEDFKKVIYGNKLYDKDDEEIKDKDVIKGYCKAVGLMMIDSKTITYKIKPDDNDNEFYKTLLDKNVYKVDGLYNVVKSIDEPKSYKHLAFGIRAYSQTMVLKQLLSMDCSKVFGVKVDSIVYDKNENITYDDKLFKAPTKSKIESMIKVINEEQKDYGLDDIFIPSSVHCNTSEYYKPYFNESNNEIMFDKSFLPNNEHITQRVLFLGGKGGSGKSHNVLSSNNLIKSKILFSSTCWELIQNKADEYNVMGLSLPKLIGEMNGQQVDKINTGFIKYKVIDETTLISKKIIKQIIKDDNKHSFIFLMGDIDHDGYYYQCSIDKNIINPSNLKCQYVKYTTNYRFDDNLNNKIDSFRDVMKKTKNVYNLYNEFSSMFSSCFYNKDDVKFKSCDVGISALQPIDKDNKCKYSEYFYNNGSDKQYYIKDTKFKNKIYKGQKLDEQPDNKNYFCSLFRTIHSYQGRQLDKGLNKIVILINSLFDFNLLYTAISRARSEDQIIIINELSSNDLYRLKQMKRVKQYHLNNPKKETKEESKEEMCDFLD